jgi:hypothetical protein
MQNKQISGVQRILIALIGMVASAALFVGPAGASHLGAPDPAFTPEKLVEDYAFVFKGGMTAADIQSFLQEKGSALASFSEGGKSAAQIIFDYTRGVQDPDGAGSGFWALDVSLHPGVVLVTLQKETSLITSGNLNNLDKAMGYGCPDGGSCNPQYSGFTNQVKYGAWQLYRNYLCADPSCSDYSNYKVGQTMTFSNTQDYDVPASQQVTISNRATGSLYRYTPHVFNGNYNFWRLFRQWFPTYSAQYVSQSATSEAGTAHFPTVTHGQSIKLTVVLKNTGSATWQQGVVNLGTDRSRDRTPGFIREGGSPTGWFTANRVILKEGTVAPGANGTFEFYYTVPATMQPGTYREYFRPVADGITWMDDWGIYFDITVVPQSQAYRAQFISQNGYPTVKRGESYQFEVKLKNTGITTWQKGVVNLGTDRGRDRIPGFIREGGNPSGWLTPNRVVLVENSVAPGAVGTFRFWYMVPSDKALGTFREYFRPVADGITWMDDWGIYWDVIVISSDPAPQNDGFHTQYVTQNFNAATVKRGDCIELVLTLKNTGSATWQQGVVNLGTDRDRDRVPGWVREDHCSSKPSGWISANRVRLEQASVAPNANGTFKFYYTVPSDKAFGTYREYFRPVADGVGWMEDYGIYWDLTVVP